MKLKSIELKNYRPYRGKIEVDFPEEKNKNIYILEGRNGAGKTSLHEAIRWCLYARGGGRRHFEKINETAVREDDEVKMHVRLKFLHEGDDYNVVRQAEKVGENRARTKLKILKNGEPKGKNKEERQHIIDNILPSNVSEFFFFDGEEMQSLARKMNGEEEQETVKEQIELLIGLKAVQNAVEDLKDVQDEVNDELDEERKKESEEEELNDELDQKKERKEELEAEISELEEEIDGLKSDKRKVEERLSQIESERLERLKKLETSIDSLEDRISEKQEQYENRIKEGHIFMLKDSIENTIEKLKKERENVEDTLNDMNISDAKRKMVEESIEGGECELCSRELDDESKESLEEMKENFEVEEERRSELEIRKVTLRKRIENLKDAIRATQNESPASLKNEIEKLKNRKEEKEGERTEIDEEIEASKEEEGKLELEKNDLEEKIRKEEAKRQNRKEELEEVRKRIKELRGKIKSISESSHASELEAQRKAIENCIDDLNNIRDRLAGTKRESILEEANKVFEILTSNERGYDRFEFISEGEYGFQIVNRDGSRPNMDHISQGEKQVVALSFIIGLNRFADRSAPIVMDTPIARLDKEYRQNLAALFSNLTEQIILLSTNASLSTSFEEILKDDIARRYKIIEDVETHTSDVEVSG